MFVFDLRMHARNQFFFKYFFCRYGSVEAYLVSIGFDEAAQDRLRACLLHPN
jgi:hypothetical protein